MPDISLISILLTATAAAAVDCYYFGSIIIPSRRRKFRLQ